MGSGNDIIPELQESPDSLGKILILEAYTRGDNIIKLTVQCRAVTFQDAREI